jgi:hypothetical protein
MKQSDIKKYLISIENNKYYYYLVPFDIISHYVKNWSKNRIQEEHKLLKCMKHILKENIYISFYI